MKAKDILQKNANKTMRKWELNTFKITHPTLYKTIIYSINEAINDTHCCTELKGEKDDDDWVQDVIDREAMSAEWRKEDL